jgi:hypothetical protein
MCTDHDAGDHLEAGLFIPAFVERFKDQVLQARWPPTPELAINWGPFAKALMQITPHHTCSRYPENPIQNKPMIARSSSTTRGTLNHKRLKKTLFLITQLSTYQSDLEPERN